MSSATIGSGLETEMCETYGVELGASGHLRSDAIRQLFIAEAALFSYICSLGIQRDHILPLEILSSKRAFLVRVAIESGFGTDGASL